MSLELIAIVVVAMIALAVYASMHKATEAKLLNALATANAYLTAHSSALNEIEGLLALHGITLTSLEDKAKNVLTEVEKSKAIQAIEDAIAKAKALVTDTTPATPAAPEPAPVLVPQLQTFNTDPVTGLPTKASA